MAELQETLAKVELVTMQSGEVISIRYIANRLTAIAKNLRELDKEH